MEPKRWLADYRIESNITVHSEEQDLQYVHPNGLFEIHIRNAPPERENENLSVQIIVSAQDIETAETDADLHLNKFLHLLSFITSGGYVVSRRMHLTDWSRGISQRESFVYTKGDLDQPFKLLSSALLDTARLLHTWGTTPILERSLRWYSAGVKSDVPEDQFQCFWFVIELLANAKKTTEKVADKCQKCGSDLYCKTCNEVSMHRPFPRQAIEALLSKLGIQDVLIEDLFVTRNGLLHGDTREDIEQHIQRRVPNFEFHKIVDLAAKVSWRIILNAFEKPHGEYRPTFLTTNTVIEWKMKARAHVITALGGDFNDPKIEDVKLPKISLRYD